MYVEITAFCSSSKVQNQMRECQGNVKLGTLKMVNSVWNQTSYAPAVLFSLPRTQTVDLSDFYKISFPQFCIFSNFFQFRGNILSENNLTENPGLYILLIAGITPFYLLQ